ncbi:MAG: porphobilinogen synthase [Spirochaetales bacterium]|nr:porphobilinogen synthase [Spirochaetales bacterium]
MAYPITRMRRLRRNEILREMIRETHLSVKDLIFPLFVCPGKGIKKEISSMPGNYRMSVDVLVETCKEIRDLGIPGIILFGIPEKKDELGTGAYGDDGIIQTALRKIKKEVDELLVITDVCLCEYTSHGHCGVIEKGVVHNDETLKLLSRQALSHAKAGADIIAPSDMMDGRVGCIRAILDANAFSDLPILSYAAKYSSAFYGPFRDAADSAPQFGNRKSYQMDYANSDEALREVKLDISEGADIIMVKPALAYLDIIYRVKTKFKVPVAAYNVSGEYACIMAAAEKGWISGDDVMLEVLYSMKRAGADIIITYFAEKAARLLQKK